MPTLRKCLFFVFLFSRICVVSYLCLNIVLMIMFRSKYRVFNRVSCLLNCRLNYVVFALVSYLNLLIVVHQSLFVNNVVFLWLFLNMGHI